jgi:2-dehydro-3-deoxy-D-arabinonate dehydratase
MLLAKIRTPDGQSGPAAVDGSVAQLLRDPSRPLLADYLEADSPAAAVEEAIGRGFAQSYPVQRVQFLAPIDQQEVWAAGVTYKRSQIARMEESETGASHYDRVYTAPRPEIFFKATANRVSGPGQPVRVRWDSNWSVPEPELALVVNSAGRLVGYTVGNDMSARDIEGENPLYLPQAKLYDQCCGLGPVIRLSEDPLDLPATTVRLTIQRGGKVAFQGETSLDQLKRGLDELVGWLTRENELVTGAFLLTGTGIVPGDDFTLEDGDHVDIEITGIGTLSNPVAKRAAP